MTYKQARQRELAMQKSAAHIQRMHAHREKHFQLLLDELKLYHHWYIHGGTPPAGYQTERMIRDAEIL